MDKSKSADKVKNRSGQARGNLDVQVILSRVKLMLTTKVDCSYS